MKQCPYYYHTWRNAIPKRCMYEEGHTGDHKEEQILAPQVQPYPFETGWRKH